MKAHDRFLDFIRGARQERRFPGIPLHLNPDDRSDSATGARLRLRHAMATLTGGRGFRLPPKEDRPPRRHKMRPAEVAARRLRRQYAGHCPDGGSRVGVRNPDAWRKHVHPRRERPA